MDRKVLAFVLGFLLVCNFLPVSRGFRSSSSCDVNSQRVSDEKLLGLTEDDSLCGSLSPNNSDFTYGESVDISFGLREQTVTPISADLVVDGEVVAQYNSGGSKSYSWDTDGELGDVVIYVYCETDNYWDNDTVTNHVNRASDESIVQNLAPSGREYEQGESVEVSFDLKSGYESYDFDLTIGGDYKGSASSSGTYTYSWDTSGLIGSISMKVSGTTKYYKDTDTESNYVSAPYLDALKGFYEFEGVHNDQLYDSSQYPNNGGLKNDGRYCGAYKGIAGEYALDNGGGGTGGTIPQTTQLESAFNSSYYTIAFWFRWEKPIGDWQDIIAMDKVDGGWRFERSYTSKGFRFYDKGEDGSQYIMGTLSVPAGEWHHVAFSWDNDTAYTFRDFEEVGSKSVSFSVSDVNGSLNLGQTTDGRYQFDRLSYFSKNLSLPQLREFYGWEQKTVKHTIKLVSSKNGKEENFGDFHVEVNGSTQHLSTFWEEEGSMLNVSVFTLERSFITSRITSQTLILISINVHELVVENQFEEDIHAIIRNDNNVVSGTGFISSHDYRKWQLMADNYTIEVRREKEGELMKTFNIELTDDDLLSVSPTSVYHYYIEYYNELSGTGLSNDLFYLYINDTRYIEKKNGKLHVPTYNEPINVTITDAWGRLLNNTMLHPSDFSNDDTPYIHFFKFSFTVATAVFENPYDNVSQEVNVQSPNGNFYNFTVGKGVSFEVENVPLGNYTIYHKGLDGNFSMNELDVSIAYSEEMITLHLNEMVYPIYSITFKNNYNFSFVVNITCIDNDSEALTYGETVFIEFLPSFSEKSVDVKEGEYRIIIAIVSSGQLVRDEKLNVTTPLIYELGTPPEDKTDSDAFSPSFSISNILILVIAIQVIIAVVVVAMYSLVKKAGKKEKRTR